MTTKKINFPTILSFDDYHDIDIKLYELRENENEPKLKAAKLDPENYGYVFDDFDENFAGAMKYYGLFYVGRKPAKSVIEQLVEKKFSDHPHWNKEAIQIKIQEPESRFFIAIKQMGFVDSKNKIGLAVGYSGKLISKPDTPLQSVIFPLIMEATNFVRYSNDIAAQNDLAEFKKLVEDLEIK